MSSTARNIPFKVFLCSTYADLVDERDAVIDVIRRLQLMHDTMEFFGARPNRPLETCLEEVRASDIALVIIGHRYGSIVPGQIRSYTDLEYEEAFQGGKPCLVYFRSDEVPILPLHMERDPAGIPALDNLKHRLLERHTVSVFKRARSLAAMVAADLGRTVSFIEENPQELNISRALEVLDLLKTPFIVLDNHNRIRSLNEAMANSLRYSVDELLNEDFFGFCDPSPFNSVQLEKWSEIWKQPSVHASLTSLEMNLLTKDGQRRYFELDIRRYGLIEGPVVQCLARDVTERIRAQQALRRSEEMFSKAFDANPDALIISTLSEGEIIKVNMGFERVTGISPDVVTGEKIQDLGIWLDSETPLRLFEALHSQGNFHDKECELRGEAQEIRSCLLSGDVVDLGGVKCGIIVLRDITERMKYQAERERLIAELEAKNVELERFTYTVSHDLKSPLVTIKGFVGLIERDIAARDFERCAKDISRIYSVTSRMDRLLNELLELSRIGRMVNPPETIDLVDLVRDGLSQVEGLVTKRGVKVNIASDMPLVFGDRVRLLQVYQNLIENAVKYIGEQVAPAVEIGARLEDDKLALCWVQDNGIGIELRYQEKVFGLFERLDYETEGTGIGLTLVKRIVEVHGGRIWIESEGTGSGSTFFFTVPMPPNNERSSGSTSLAATSS